MKDLHVVIGISSRYHSLVVYYLVILPRAPGKRIGNDSGVQICVAETNLNTLSLGKYSRGFPVLKQRHPYEPLAVAKLDRTYNLN